MACASMVEVSNLSEYIEVLKQMKSQEVAFYRGENMFFNERIASAFRPYRNGLHLFDFEKLVNFFYREVYSKISENDKKHFMAFAQHHFIPTNLIDITTNPLSALWFACDGVSKEGDGFVHCFDNNYIDITEFVSEEFMEFDLIRKLFLIPETGNLTSTQRDLFFCMINNTEFYKNYRNILANVKEAYTKRKGEETNHNDIGFVYEENEIDDINELLNEFELAYIATPSKQKSRLATNDEVYLFAQIYRLFPIEIFKMLIDVIPNLLYNPILSFDRAVKQSGCFFYQTYLFHSFPGVNCFENHSLQRIKVYATIKIKNRGEILEELDGVGINRKTIYADFDNTARYLLENFKKYYDQFECFKIK